MHFVSTASEAGPLAYVALERVEGTLDGRRGAFVLQHVGAIVDGVPSLALSVVAGSGTGDLAGSRAPARSSTPRRAPTSTSTTTSRPASHTTSQKPRG